MSFYYGETVLDPIVLQPYLWNRADAVTVDAEGRVSSFDDLAGNGNYLNQGTAGNQPRLTSSLASLNNQPVVKFDGVNDTYTSVANCLLDSEPEWEFYVVYDLTTITVDMGYIGDTSGIRFFYTNNQLRNRIRRDDLSYSTYSSGLSSNLGIMRMRIINYPSGTDRLKLKLNIGNEVNQGIGSGGFWNLNGLLGFGHSGVQATPYDGYLAETMVFKRHLSPREEKHLYHYFARRYNVFEVKR